MWQFHVLPHSSFTPFMMPKTATLRKWSHHRSILLVSGKWPHLPHQVWKVSLVRYVYVLTFVTMVCCMWTWHGWFRRSRWRRRWMVRKILPTRKPRCRKWWRRKPSHTRLMSQWHQTLMWLVTRASVFCAFASTKPKCTSVMYRLFEPGRRRMNWKVTSWITVHVLRKVEIWPSTWHQHSSSPLRSSVIRMSSGSTRMASMPHWKPMRNVWRHYVRLVIQHSTDTKYVMMFTLHWVDL